MAQYPISEIFLPENSFKEEGKVYILSDVISLHTL